MWPWWCVGLYDTVILSCLVSKVYFNCIVHDILYHNMDIGTMWHCALVSRTPQQSKELLFGCPLFWCWESFCIPFTISVIGFYFIIIFIMIVVTIIGILMAILSFWTAYLGFMELSSSGPANAQLPGLIRPWTFSLNIGLNMLSSNAFMSFYTPY